LDLFWETFTVIMAYLVMRVYTARTTFYSPDKNDRAERYNVDVDNFNVTS